MGTCDGSGKLPYELSCEYLSNFVVLCEEKKQKILQEAASVRTSQDSTKTWVQAHEGWREAEVVDAGNGGFMLKSKSSTTGRPSIWWAIALRVYANTAQGVCEAQNAKYAEWLEQVKVKHLEQYIQWTKRRISEWKLRELKPIGGK